MDVSKLDGIDPATIEMKIAGIGKVPAEFDPVEKKITWIVNETLRGSECQVFVTFKRKDEPKADIVSWRFSIDLIAHYLPDEPEKLEKATVVEETVLTQPDESVPAPAPDSPRQ